MSTIFIVAANLIVGQLIERTKALAGKAPQRILDKHYMRKYGLNAYYGQMKGGRS